MSCMALSSSIVASFTKPMRNPMLATNVKLKIMLESCPNLTLADARFKTVSRSCQTPRKTNPKSNPKALARADANADAKRNSNRECTVHNMQPSFIKLHEPFSAPFSFFSTLRFLSASESNAILKTPNTYSSTQNMIPSPFLALCSIQLAELTSSLSPLVPASLRHLDLFPNEQLHMLSCAPKRDNRDAECKGKGTRTAMAKTSRQDCASNKISADIISSSSTIQGYMMNDTCIQDWEIRGNKMVNLTEGLFQGNSGDANARGSKKT